MSPLLHTTLLTMPWPYGTEHNFSLLCSCRNGTAPDGEVVVEYHRFTVEGGGLRRRSANEQPGAPARAVLRSLPPARALRRESQRRHRLPGCARLAGGFRLPPGQRAWAARRGAARARVRGQRHRVADAQPPRRDSGRTGRPRPTCRQAAICGAVPGIRADVPAAQGHRDSVARIDVAAVRRFTMFTGGLP